MTKDDIENLAFTDIIKDDAGQEIAVSVPLLRGHQGKVRAFTYYVSYLMLNDHPVKNDDWISLTQGDFDDFRISPNYQRRAEQAMITPDPSSSYRSDPVRDFRRAIKKDTGSFPTLTTDAHWITWDATVTAQAHAQGVEDVLDGSYAPTTAAEKDLFRVKQDFMYAVFIACLLTDKGKAVVRDQQRTRNAQKVYQDIKDYYEVSTKAAIESSKKLEYTITSRLDDGHWHGTTHTFILHWKEQIH